MRTERPRPAGVSAPVSDKPTKQSGASIFSTRSRAAFWSLPALYARYAWSIRSAAVTPPWIGAGSIRFPESHFDFAMPAILSQGSEQEIHLPYGGKASATLGVEMLPERRVAREVELAEHPRRDERSDRLVELPGEIRKRPRKRETRHQPGVRERSRGPGKSRCYGLMQPEDPGERRRRRGRRRRSALGVVEGDRRHDPARGLGSDDREVVPEARAWGGEGDGGRLPRPGRPGEDVRAPAPEHTGAVEGETAALGGETRDEEACRVLHRAPDGLGRAVPDRQFPRSLHSRERE